MHNSSRQTQKSHSDAAVIAQENMIFIIIVQNARIFSAKIMVNKKKSIITIASIQMTSENDYNNSVSNISLE